MNSIASITRKYALTPRTRGNAERRRLSSVDVRKAVLARKRADVDELARLLEHAPVGRERNNRAAKICGGFLRPAGAVEGIQGTGTPEGFDDTLGPHEPWRHRQGGNAVLTQFLRHGPGQAGDGVLRQVVEEIPHVRERLEVRGRAHDQPRRRGSISGTARRLAVRCARTPAVNMPSHC